MKNNDDGGFSCALDVPDCGGGPFDKSDAFVVKHGVKDSKALKLEEECSLVSPLYIRHHLKAGIIFFIFFGIFAFLIVLVREFFRASCYFMMGYPIDQINISADGGSFIAPMPDDAPCWWCMLIFLGPSLLVDGSIILMLLVKRRWEDTPVFLNGSRSGNMNTRTMKKALGWFCALKVMSTILFFPVISGMYAIFHVTKTSDLVSAWESIDRARNAGEIVFMRCFVIFSAAYLLVLGILYLYNIDRGVDVD